MKTNSVIETRGKTIAIKKCSVFYFFIKRFFDLLFSFLSLCILLPLLLILLLINTIATKGHPIFADERIGRNEKPIKVLKFRTMFFDAETNIDKYFNSEQKEEWLQNRKLANDPRITKFGNILRKTSLDELPQLLNIFAGSMSFVGPRPMSFREIQTQFTENEKKLILSAEPGLTGYWQINGRSNSSFTTGERQMLEIEYFSKRDLFFDFYVILKTFLVVIKRDGAE